MNLRALSLLAAGETTSTSITTSSTPTTTSTTIGAPTAPTTTATMTMTTSGSATTGSTSTTTPSPPTVPTADRSPLAGSPRRAIVLAHRQRGHAVRGSLEVAAAGVHGTATIDVLATEAQLSPSATGRRARRSVSVGHVRTRLTRSGRRSFSVALDRAARAALGRGRGLTLTVLVTVRSPHGVVQSARRAVVVRPSGA